MKLTRRQFLKASAASMTAFMLPPGLARRAAASTSNPVLVAVYLRGGADGLTLVPPTFDPLYYDNRPTIQIPPGAELALSDGFGLNPALASLQPLYQSGDMLVVHASGSTDPSRSHFDAQDFMERAAPGDKTQQQGWLNRYLAIAGGGLAMSGLTLAKKKAKAILGPAPSLAFSSIADFVLQGESIAERRAALEVRYASEGGILGGAVSNALDAIDVVGAVDTSTSVTYPIGELGDALKDAAALIKADIGIHVITVDLGGWDHHSDQNARMAALAAELGDSLAAFYLDLETCASTTLTLCMTEFGRRVGENGGGGSDHGHGGIMFALGAGIAGGRVLLKDGHWPGLAPEDLFIGQDLAVTTDFRDIFAEALHKHMSLGLNDVGSVFPNFTASSANFPSLFL